MHAMTTAITRHFVTLDGRRGPRQVHYRRAGQGPAVLLLHQSPLSSREMLDLMRRWAPHFTLIAPDTPGYGQSDPLGADTVPIDGFATAVAEFADAIGLRRFGVFGNHTGASIGLWLAAAHPERVTALAAHGLPCFDTREQANILANYLPPLVPSWDGAHLAWLWARLREQSIFFPWHERQAEARLALDMPPPARLQFNLLEFLRAGEHYATAYRAAFASQPGAVLATLRVPLLVTATPGDPLRGHFTRFGTLPPLATVTPAADPTAALEHCLACLLAWPGDPAPAPVATRPVAERLWNTMVRTAEGELRVQLSLCGNREPLLLVHGAGESSDTARHLVTRLLPDRPVILPDLPGHGESAPPSGGAGPGVAQAAQAVLATLAAVGVNQAALAGSGAGAWVALEAARRGTVARDHLALLDAPLLDAPLAGRWLAEGVPAIEPQWHGGHLLAAWHLVRDSRLFFPWFERNRTGARRIAPDLDPHRLHLEVRDLLKAEGAWQDLWRSALTWDAAAALRDRGAGLLGAATTSGWQAATRAAATHNPRLGCIDLPAAPPDWLPALLRHWD